MNIYVSIKYCYGYRYDPVNHFDQYFYYFQNAAELYQKMPKVAERSATRLANIILWIFSLCLYVYYLYYSWFGLSHNQGLEIWKWQASSVSTFCPVSKRPWVWAPFKLHHFLTLWLDLNFKFIHYYGACSTYFIPRNRWKK